MQNYFWFENVVYVCNQELITEKSLSFLSTESFMDEVEYKINGKQSE